MSRFHFFYKHLCFKKLLSQSSFKKNSFKNKPVISKVIVLLSFKDSVFNKKQGFPFILFLFDFLIHQKVVFGFSFKDSLVWSIRKKDLVSLALTLRGVNIYSFLEKLSFAPEPKAHTFVQEPLLSGRGCFYSGPLDFSLFSELGYEHDIIQSDTFKFQFIIIFN